MPPRLISWLPSHPATRALIYSTLAGSSGRALFITMSVVFFTRSVGLSAAEVGFGLTIAAMISLFVGVPAGHLADRMGPRAVTFVLGSARAVGTLGYLLVGDFLGFVLVATVLSLLDAAGGAAHGALLAGAVPAEERVQTRAYLRSVTNVGWAVGGVGAGAALHFDTRFGYTMLILVCVACSLLASGLILRVPAVAPMAKPKDGPRFLVLRDRPYLSLAVLNGILCIHYGMLNVAVPLWVVQRTDAPAWVVGGLALLNAVVVILFQVRASRGVGEANSAAAAQRVAGFLLAGACVLYAMAEGQPMWVAAGILFAGPGSRSGPVSRHVQHRVGAGQRCRPGTAGNRRRRLGVARMGPVWNAVRGHRRRCPDRGALGAAHAPSRCRAGARLGPILAIAVPRSRGSSGKVALATAKQACQPKPRRPGG